MIRRFVGALALAAVVTTGARAQAPFQDNFWFNPGTINDTPKPNGQGGLNWASYFGQFTVTTPSVVAATGVQANTIFQVFCVDQLKDAIDGSKYDVWVTPMSSSDFSKTRLGIAGDANAATKYFQAANLASNYQNAYPGTSATLGDANIDNLQYAIWTIMGTIPPAPNSTIDPWNSGAGDYCASSVIVGCAGWDVANLSSGLGLSPNQWLIITAFDLETNDYQEFIYNGPGRPQEVVPEPGTMTMLALGLVGLAGSGLRRRKNKKV
jgi:hypothetical protein